MVICKLEFIFQTRLWLNTCVINKQVVPIRSDVIKYMCDLSDRDLRLAGTKNTTDLMYESFKDYHPLVLAVEQQHQSSISSGAVAGSKNTVENHSSRSYAFKIDQDGLQLAYKYFMCSTLTIRLCGINQMNVRVDSLSLFYFSFDRFHFYSNSNSFK